MSVVVYAHQPDLSTLVISKTNQGKYIIQLSSALTAFEGEVEYKFSKRAYKTPEEFRALVIKHFIENTTLIFNTTDTVIFTNPIVILGHETKLVAELKGFPLEKKSIYFKSTVFKDIHHNQSAVIMLVEGLPKQQYTLSNENNHELNLTLKEGKWTIVNNKSDSFNYQNLLYLLILIIPASYFFIRLRNKK